MILWRVSQRDHVCFRCKGTICNQQNQPVDRPEIKDQGEIHAECFLGRGKFMLSVFPGSKEFSVALHTQVQAVFGQVRRCFVYKSTAAIVLPVVVQAEFAAVEDMFLLDEQESLRRQCKYWNAFRLLQFCQLLLGFVVFYDH